MQAQQIIKTVKEWLTPGNLKFAAVAIGAIILAAIIFSTCDKAPVVKDQPVDTITARVDSSALKAAELKAKTAIAQLEAAKKEIADSKARTDKLNKENQRLKTEVAIAKATADTSALIALVDDLQAQNDRQAAELAAKDSTITEVVNYYDIALQAANDVALQKTRLAEEFRDKLSQANANIVQANRINADLTDQLNAANRKAKSRQIGNKILAGGLALFATIALVK